MLKITVDDKGNSAEQLRMPRSAAYSAAENLLNKQQILGMRSCSALLP